MPDMPDDPLPPDQPPAASPPEPPAPPPLGAPPPPGPVPDPLPPPMSSGATWIGGVFKFTGGCLLTILAGFLLAVTAFQNMRKDEAYGCAAAQLIYIIPALILLFRKNQPAWAFGIIFGGSIVLLLASTCGNMSFH